VFQGQRKAINKDELKATIQAIERAHNLCSENKGSSELIADVGTLFSCLKYVPFWVFIWSFISVNVSVVLHILVQVQDIKNDSNTDLRRLSSKICVSETIQ